jgi:hypothetical protein
MVSTGNKSYTAEANMSMPLSSDAFGHIFASRLISSLLTIQTSTTSTAATCSTSLRIASSGIFSTITSTNNTAMSTIEYEVNYNQVMTVTHSWDKIKMMPDYEARFGKLLFEK